MPQPQTPHSSSDQIPLNPAGMLGRIERLFGSNTDTHSLASAEAFLRSALAALRIADGQQNPDENLTPSAMLAEIGTLTLKLRQNKRAVGDAIAFLRSALATLGGNVEQSHGSAKKGLVGSTRERISQIPSQL